MGAALYQICNRQNTTILVSIWARTPQQATIVLLVLAWPLLQTRELPASRSGFGPCCHRPSAENKSGGSIHENRRVERCFNPERQSHGNGEETQQRRAGPRDRTREDSYT